MTAHDIENIVCHGCYAMLDVGDKFCRHCGAPTNATDSAGQPGQAVAAVPSQAVRATPSARPKATHGRWIIIVLLFAVLGPGALPMLWQSDQFSLTWKIVLTVLVLGITALAIWLLWYVTEMSLAPLRELKTLKGF